MLGGAARITISLAMILMEVTGDAEFMLPFFLTVMLAKWTGDVFNKGIYDLHIIELKHIPLLEHKPEKDAMTLRARDVMSRKVVGLEVVDTVENIVHCLEACKHQAFPVHYPGTRRLVGMVSRKILTTVLETGREHGVFQEPSGELLRPAPLVPYELVLDWHPGMFASWQEAHRILEDVIAKRVDLRPYVSTSCYTVHKQALVYSCYHLFRQMGLRHLPVLDNVGEVCGIVTRKDLILVEGEHTAAASGVEQALCSCEVAEDSTDSGGEGEDEEEICDQLEDGGGEASEEILPHHQAELNPHRAALLGGM